MDYNEKLNIRLTKKMLQRLRRYKKDSGVPVAEVIRRAVDLYLQEREKDAPRA